MAKTRKSSEPQTRFVRFTDADGQEVVVNPALVQFVSPAGHETPRGADPDHADPKGRLGCPNSLGTFTTETS
jgi:hypothetical protein